MLKLFRTKQQSILGIDLSSTSVRILEITSSSGKHTVQAYGEAILPEKVFEGSVIKDTQKVADVIKKILSISTFSSNQAVIAVPDSSTISKTIQLDALLSESEMEEMIISESDKYIPYPIDEINMDFNILGPSAKNSALVDVLIVASRAENVNNRAEVMRLANLEPIIIEVESYAIERAAQTLAPSLPAAGEKKNIAILDIGAQYTHLSVLHSMKTIFSHEEEFGGKQLIDSIMQQYQMNYQEALEGLEHQSLPKDYEDKVLQPFKDLILLQVKRALQFFFSSSHHTFVDYIVLCGGVAKLEGIVSLIQENTNIPTMLANPFTNMSFSRNLDPETVIKDAPKLMIACGLALRGRK